MTAVRPTNPVPASADDVTAGWIEEALGCGGAFNTPRLVSLEREPIATGLGALGDLFRLRLVWGYSDKPGPASIILKLPSSVPTNCGRAARFGLYEREVRFYQEFARFLGQSVPRCYYSHWDDASRRSVLLLEDLQHLEASDQIAGIDLEDALLAVSEIGHVHAMWWNSPRLRDVEWMPLFCNSVMMQLAAIYAELWPLFIESWRESLPAGSIQLGERVRDCFPDLLDRMSRPPVTIVHGDLRVDNLLFKRDAARNKVTILDWQLATRGRAAFDVAYLLSQSMTVETRRRHEMTIVRRWHDSLIRHGVTGYSLEDAVDDYRLSALVCLGWTVAGTVLDRGNERGRALAQIQVTRSFSAALDLVPESGMRR
jgi:hypothetical protein